MISGSDISVASFWIVFSFVTHHLVTTGYCWIGFLYSIHCKTASISLLRPFEAHGDMFFSKISSKLVMSPLVSYGWWLLLLLVYGLALSCFFFFFGAGGTQLLITTWIQILCIAYVKYYIHADKCQWWSFCFIHWTKNSWCSSDELYHVRFQT